MDILKNKAFFFLCSRAVAMVDKAVPSVSTVRYLSSTAASLVSLSHCTTNAKLQNSASVCVQQLLSHIVSLPPAKVLSEGVVVDVFRIVKNGGGNLASPKCITSLLREVDERIIESQFAMWRPARVVASLHAIAIASPVGFLGMVNNLLFCAKNLLRQLDEQRTARLLWCIAILKMHAVHLELWRLTCRRLVRFANVLSKTSRALVAEALIIVSECMCDAQHELLCALQETRPVEEGFVAYEKNDLLTVRVGSEYSTLKSRLLLDVHLMPVESVVFMLLRTLDRSMLDTEIRDYLLQHLICRPLKATICYELLQFLASVEATEITQSLRRRALECIRMEVLQTSYEGRNIVRDLSAVCIALALEQEQVHDVRTETRLLLEDLIARCHDMRDNVWNRYSGRIACVLAVALDLLASCSKLSADRNYFAETSKLLEQFPSSWGLGGVTASLISECANCVCGASDLLRVPPVVRFLPSSPSLSPLLSLGVTCTKTLTTAAGNSEQHSSAFDDGGSLTDALLQRCTEVFASEFAQIPAGVLFDMWRAGGSVVVARPAALQPLMELLLSYAEQHRFEFPLRDVSKFIGAEGHQFPAEAFELFVRCLLSERDCATPPHLEVLVAALESVAARGEKTLLERLQLLLFMRPLGHEAGLVHTVDFTTSQLVRLFSACGGACDLAAAMQSTLLELIVRSCEKCETMHELNSAASLLSRLPSGPLKDSLACAVAGNGRRMNPVSTPDVQKALLIVYLQKGGIKVDEALLKTLRQRV